MDNHKGDNGVKIQSTGTSHYSIVRKVVLLGVSDNCVKKTKRFPCTNKYIYLKVLWNGLNIMHWICNSYGITITPVGHSYRQCPTFLQTRIRGGGGQCK